MASPNNKAAEGEKFLKSVVSSASGIVQAVTRFSNLKADSGSFSRVTKNASMKGILKLADANNAGGAQSHKCTLILCEGDSAKTFAVTGLSVVGRDNYGVFPLKGKPLNVRGKSMKAARRVPR